jgi:hypothetical protein
MVKMKERSVSREGKRKENQWCLLLAAVDIIIYTSEKNGSRCVDSDDIRAP